MTDENDAGRAGASFDAFLAEEGMLEETNERAIKRVIAWQLSTAMEAEGLSKAALAERIGTSRSQLDRLLDPMAGNVTLATLSRAARALGRTLRLELS